MTEVRTQAMTVHDSDDYAYRFQYADGSAFVVLADGRAFITFPEKDGRSRPPEQKFGKIDNRIPLLIGRVAEPRQARIAELESNEKAYEEIIGKKTYREVADLIGELESELASERRK